MAAAAAAAATPEVTMVQMRMAIERLAESLDVLRGEYASLAQAHGVLQQQIQDHNANIINGNTGNGPNKFLVDKKFMLPDKYHPLHTKPSFRNWSRSVKAYVRGIISKLRVAMERVEGTNEVVDYQIRAALGVANIEELDEQLYSVLNALTDGDAKGIVESAAAESGLEAWRSLIRQYDPRTTARTMHDIGAILHPGKAKKLVDFPALVLKWEQLLDEYAARTGERISDAQKKYILKNMLPDDWMEKMSLNMNQYDTYEKAKGALLDVCHDMVKVPTPMDMSELSVEKEHESTEEFTTTNEHGEPEIMLLQKKGGKVVGIARKFMSNQYQKGDNKGKVADTRQCFRCGRTGHISTNCVAKKHKNGGPCKEKPGTKSANLLEEEVVDQDLSGMDFDILALDPEIPPGLSSDPLMENDPWAAAKVNDQHKENMVKPQLKHSQATSDVQAINEIFKESYIFPGSQHKTRADPDERAINIGGLAADMVREIFGGAGETYENIQHPKNEKDLQTCTQHPSPRYPASDTLHQNPQTCTQHPVPRHPATESSGRQQQDPMQKQTSSQVHLVQSNQAHPEANSGWVRDQHR